MEQVFSDDNVRVKDKTKLQFISFDQGPCRGWGWGGL